MRNEERDRPRSSFLGSDCALPNVGRVADSCSRHERGQHHEEGDPGERNEKISRRIEVTHHEPPGGVGWCISTRAMPPAVQCSSVMGVTQ